MNKVSGEYVVFLLVVLFACLKFYGLWGGLFMFIVTQGTAWILYLRSDNGDDR